MTIRNARYAARLMNENGTEFAKHPELGDLLYRLKKVQDEAGSGG